MTMTKTREFTNRELLELYHGLSKLNDLRGAKFMYALDKNLSMLESEVKSMQKSTEASEQFKEYETDRDKLNREYSKKDDEGNPKIITKDGISKYVILPSVRESYDSEMEKLVVKYQEAIDERTKELQEYADFLEDVNKGFAPFKINPDYIPEDISWEQYKVIRELIDEKEE